MAERKLAEDNALDELIAQAFDLRSTIGKNVIALHKHFTATNNTTCVSMLRTLAAIVRQKGHENFDGRIEVRVGPLQAGQLLAVPVVHDGVRKVHERITDASPYSGKELVHGYPLAYTLYDRDDNVLVRAGYRAGTRLKEDEGELIGPDQIDTLLLYVPLLPDPKLPRMLKAPPKRERQERIRKARKRLEDILQRMPKDFAAYAAKRDVDLKALATIDMLEVGEHLKEEKWSALLWALDPGKHHTILNWYKAKLRADDLPADVKQAWIDLNTMPHRVTELEFMLLAAYRLQAKPERRKGIAGNIGEELTWLAKQGEPSRARELYGRAIDLQQPHDPARFYAGGRPSQPMSIEEKLTDPFWTYADREGILRNFPLSAFRKQWNRIVLNDAFGDARAFSELCKELYVIYQADYHSIAAANGPDAAKTRLGSNYKFVSTMFERMSDKGSTAWAREKLLKHNPVHTSEQDFKKLHVFGQAAKLEHDVDTLRATNEVFTDRTTVYSVPDHGTLKIMHETLPVVDFASIDPERSTVGTLVREFDALRERLPEYRSLTQLGTDFTAKLETILDWKDHVYGLLPTKSFELNTTFQELLGHARATDTSAYVSPQLLHTVDELVQGIKRREQQILRKRQQLAEQGHDLGQMVTRLRAVQGKTYVQPYQFGISFVQFELPVERYQQTHDIDQIIGQLSDVKREPNENYVQRVADALARVEHLQEFTMGSVLLDEASARLYDAKKQSYDLFGVCVSGTPDERAAAMNDVFSCLLLSSPLRAFRQDSEFGYYVMRNVPHDKIERLCQQVYEHNVRYRADCKLKLV